MEKIVASGKRKTSIARTVLTKGSGKITINKIPYENLHLFDKLKIEEPLRITKNVIGKIEFDAAVEIKGGGEKSQIDAARISLAKAIIKFANSKELEKAFVEYDRNLLVADIRRKEAYKPGDSKARSKRQSSKR